MSCLWCQYCGYLVDTDDDPEALFDTDTKLDVVQCESCRKMSEIDHRLNDAANAADMEIDCRE